MLVVGAILTAPTFPVVWTCWFWSSGLRYGSPGRRRTRGWQTLLLVILGREALIVMPKCATLRMVCWLPNGATTMDNDVDRKDRIMGVDDKAKNKAEEVIGKAKESVGDETDNERLQEEGQADKAKAKAKQAGEHVKDAAKDAKTAFTG